MSSPETRVKADLECPNCRAIYRYQIDLSNPSQTVSCQNCGHSISVDMEEVGAEAEAKERASRQWEASMPYFIPGFTHGAGQSRIAWPRLCMGCGTQDNLTEIEEPLERGAVIGSESFGMLTRRTIRTFRGTAHVCLCRSCKDSGARSASIRQRSASYAAVASTIVLFLFWLPRGPMIDMLAFVSALWIPLIFISMGPAKRLSFIDTYGTLAITQKSGEVGFLFRNKSYQSAFTPANPLLPSLQDGEPIWATRDPSGYRVRSCAKADLGCTFLCGVLMLGTFVGYAYYGISLLLPLGAGIITMLLYEKSLKRESIKSS